MVSLSSTRKSNCMPQSKFLEQIFKSVCRQTCTKMLSSIHNMLHGCCYIIMCVHWQLTINVCVQRRAIKNVFFKLSQSWSAPHVSNEWLAAHSQSWHNAYYWKYAHLYTYSTFTHRFLELRANSVQQCNSYLRYIDKLHTCIHDYVYIIIHLTLKACAHSNASWVRQALYSNAS